MQKTIHYLVSILPFLICSSKSEPLPDMVLYGRVFDPNTSAQIGPLLPGRILALKGATFSPTDPVVAECSVLKVVPSEAKGYYFLRVRRESVDSTGGDGGLSARPGDQLHVFFDRNGNGSAESGEEVLETRFGQVMVGNTPREVMYLDLNRPFADSDEDHLPDDWEKFYFGNLGAGSSDQPAADGVDNLIAYASGLSPFDGKVHLMPFLKRDTPAELSYYFRKGVAVRNVDLAVESCDSLAGPWIPVGGTPVELGTWKGSTLVRLSILQGIDRPRRFFRLRVKHLSP